MAQNAGFPQISTHLPPFVRYRATSSRNSVRMGFTRGSPRLWLFFHTRGLANFHTYIVMLPGPVSPLKLALNRVCSSVSRLLPEVGLLELHSSSCILLVWLSGVA